MFSRSLQLKNVRSQDGKQVVHCRENDVRTETVRHDQALQADCRSEGWPNCLRFVLPLKSTWPEVSGLHEGRSDHHLRGPLGLQSQPYQAWSLTEVQRLCPDDQGCRDLRCGGLHFGFSNKKAANLKHYPRPAALQFCGPRRRKCFENLLTSDEIETRSVLSLGRMPNVL